jgi:hypothetical protein
VTEVFLNLTEDFLTLTEGFPCFFLSCKANTRVKLAKMGHGPHSSTLVVICVVRLLFVLFYVLFVCKCVLPPDDNPTTVTKYIIYKIKCTYYCYQNMIDSYEVRCSYKILILKHDEYLVHYLAENNNFPKNTNIKKSQN